MEFDERKHDEPVIENARLAVAQVDSNELARLREGYRELMRLRAEVAFLRTELAAKASADAETSTPAEAEEVQSVAAEGPTLFRAQFQVTLPLGSTILTGGWATGVGRRSLVVLTPNLWGEAGPDGQVLVTSHFVEAPEQALLEMGLEFLLTELPTVSTGFVVDPAKAQSILDQFKEAEGVDILASPRVSVTDGQQAQISSLGPGGETWKGLVGATVDLIPRLSPDGRNVELTVITELVERFPRPVDAGAAGR